jgi:HK97 family phage major capsid protein
MTMDIDIHNRAPENKSGMADATPVTHDDVMRIFEDFKAANDEKLAEIERHAADAVTEDKVERINAALTRRIDELALKAARPALASARPNERPEESAQSTAEHKAAFDGYMRTGDSEGLRALERKAMSVGSNPDGGYTVTAETENAIGRRLADISPIRSISGRREISTGVYRKPMMTAGPAVGWVGETAARPQTDTPVIDALNFPAMELYAMPAATATLLEDTAVDLEEWLASEVEQAFADQEGTAFVTGDGNNKPKGFLAYDNVANASWSWGNIGYVASGAAGAFPASNPSDVLIDLIYALRAGYRRNG